MSNQGLVDLSKPDSSALDRGRPFLYEALWYFLGSPLVESRWIVSKRFRSWLLGLFGASIGSNILFKPRLRVKFPWYLTIGNDCWIGEDVWIDNLTTVVIGSDVCISQGVYFCTGNHDWNHPNLRLFTKPITICDGAWVGAKSTIAPGVIVGEGAIATAGSVVYKDIPAFEIHSGNPATFVKARKPIVEAAAPDGLEFDSCQSDQQIKTTAG